MFQFFQRIAAESRLQNFIGVFVSLEIVGSGTLQPGSDFIKIIFAVQFTDNPWCGIRSPDFRAAGSQLSAVQNPGQGEEDLSGKGNFGDRL